MKEKLKKIPEKLKEVYKENKVIIICLIILLLIIAFVRQAQAMEPPINCYHFISEIDLTEITEALNNIEATLEKTQEYMNQGIEAKTAGILWLVGLKSFGIGISIMTIFAILWGRTK